MFLFVLEDLSSFDYYTIGNSFREVRDLVEFTKIGILISEPIRERSSEDNFS